MESVYTVIKPSLSKSHISGKLESSDVHSRIPAPVDQ